MNQAIKTSPGLEMIGGRVPFVTPTNDFEPEWFHKVTLKEAEDAVRKGDVRTAGRLVAAVESQIGTTAAHVIEATRGQSFQLGPMPSRRDYDEPEPAPKEGALTESDIRELDKIEAQRMAQPIKAGNNAIALVKTIKARGDENWAVAANAETVALAVARDETLEQPAAKRGERRKPISRLSPLAKMRRDKTLTEPQGGAGAKYGDLWRSLYPEGSIKSNIDFSVRGNWAPSEARARALEALDEARTALGYDARKIELLDRLCGKDETLNSIAKSDTAQRERLFQRLKDALDQLADHWKMA